MRCSRPCIDSWPMKPSTSSLSSGSSMRSRTRSTARTKKSSPSGNTDERTVSTWLPRMSPSRAKCLGRSSRHASNSISRVGTELEGICVATMHRSSPRRRRGKRALPALRLGDRPRRVDQPDVAEGLGEVAEQLARVGIDLFGEQAEIVAEPDGRLERVAGPVELTGHRLGLGQPERAEKERALL